MRSFDVVVIGGGPAGLAAAGELVRRGKSVLVVDQGPAADRRERSSPDDLLAGIGGAGLFSDGKFSFAPAATNVWKLPGADAAFARVASLLGIAVPDPTSASAPGAWTAKPYPSVYLGLAARMALIETLRAAAGTVEHSTRVTGVIRSIDAGGFRVALDREVVGAQRLVIATGRWSARWIRPWLEPLGATYHHAQLEFGVRLEGDASHALFAKLPGVDGKLRFVDQHAHSEIRTFATCRDGEVVVGHADGIRAFSGRADGPATGRSNVGVVVRTFHAALAREVLRFVDRASPTSLPLATWLGRPALLDPVFGTAGTLAALHAVKRLLGDLAVSDELVVHAPVVEAIGEYPILDAAQRAAPDVYVAGDTGGCYRGIVAALVGGTAVGQLLG